MRPYKNRKLDPSKPVEVYRNVNKGPCSCPPSFDRCCYRHGDPTRGIPPFKTIYSIRQGGRVIAHAEELYLRDVSFVVQQSGRRLVLMTGRKNVHAWVRGWLVPGWVHDPKVSPLREKIEMVVYNPKVHRTFVRKDKPSDWVDGAYCAHVNPYGVWVHGVTPR